jgi:hypothetical protein
MALVATRVPISHDGLWLTDDTSTHGHCSKDDVLSISSRTTIEETSVNLGQHCRHNSVRLSGASGPTDYSQLRLFWYPPGSPMAQDRFRISLAPPNSGQKSERLMIAITEISPIDIYRQADLTTVTVNFDAYKARELAFVVLVTQTDGAKSPREVARQKYKDLVTSRSLKPAKYGDNITVVKHVLSLAENPKKLVTHLRYTTKWPWADAFEVFKNFDDDYRSLTADRGTGFRMSIR